MISVPTVAAAVLTLLPFLTAAFFPKRWAKVAQALPSWLRLGAPALLSAPYLLVTLPAGVFQWKWFAVYACVPVCVAWLLLEARRIDPAQRRTWRDFLVLAALGLAVDLRWLERAWPPHLAVFNKMLLLDTGIYGFLALRQLDGVGFDLRLKPRDLGISLRELAFYTPIALALGLSLGFLHLHGRGAWLPHAWLPRLPVALLFTFFFIAVPEELFFRGWLQNLLERRMGRLPALLLTAVLFGMAHFNKRAVHFNWRYVLMAALAGVFYGRAWRQQRRVGASAITHACVDIIWSLWLR